MPTSSTWTTPSSFRWRRRRARCRAGAERDRRCESRRLAQRAGDFARFRPRRGDPRAARRHGHQGPASAASAERGYFRRRFPITGRPSRTRRWRKAQLDRAKLLLSTRARSRRRIWKSPRMPTTRPKSMSRRPWNTSACWARTSSIPARVVDIHAPVSGVITDQNVTAAAGRQDPGQLAQPVHHFRSLAASGSSATCTKTICPVSTSANPPRST